MSFTVQSQISSQLIKKLFPLSKEKVKLKWEPQIGRAMPFYYEQIGKIVK